jgi:large subunit ribosomal protein L28
MCVYTGLKFWDFFSKKNPEYRIFKYNIVMSKVCELTGKRPLKGNHVSHSNHKTKRHFMPNLKKKRIFVPELNDFVEVKISMSALRTISKHGLYDYVKKLQKKGVGIGFDLRPDAAI